MKRKLLLSLVTLFVAVGLAGDYNDQDTHTVRIVWRHDLGYTVDTVRAITWHQVSKSYYYVRGVLGVDYWSDKEPEVIE